MKIAEIPVIKTEIDGCRVTLLFAEKTVEGVIETMQSILSNAYDERVQNDLIEIAGHK